VIRLAIVSGARKGHTLDFGHEPVRVGRATTAELRFGGVEDITVSTHHAQIVFERGAYWLVDTGSTNGTLLNGVKISKQALRSGDRICFGGPGGPEVDVHIDEAAGPSMPLPHLPNTLAGVVADALRPRAADAAAEDARALELANEAAREVAERRARAGGQRSGDTVMILAKAMNRASVAASQAASVEATTRTTVKWRRVLAGVAGGALIVIAALGVVVFVQQQQIDRLVNAKASIDGQIRALQLRMQTETDTASLAALEDKLSALTGSAQNTLAELQLKDEARAAQLAASGDDLDREIRRILAKFNAQTYAIPPIFKERLQFHIDELARAGNLRAMYNRKLRYWPAILKDFGAMGLPEEMAYVAWVESGFDPSAQSPAGAVGLWQMTSSTAQSLGLTVNSSLDERLDPDKQTQAAARYLARLLSEFGEDSFMLVLASYNRGENGVRRALSQVAREAGGFRKDKRDFWHLYRLKLLPEETREYVPKVLAAAIISNNPRKYGLVN
jgi:membrane-bound lytic murein transglycosylase D